MPEVVIEWLLITCIALIVGYAFLVQKRDFTPPKTQAPTKAVFESFCKVDSLLVNRSELTFYRMLLSDMPRGYTLHTKVRMEDIVRVKPTITEQRLRWHMRGRVKSRHVDFLILDWQGQPCAVIELDGKSHNARTKNADDLKTGIFLALGLPFYRVRVGEDFASHIMKIKHGLSPL